MHKIIPILVITCAVAFGLGIFTVYHFDEQNITPREVYDSGWYSADFFTGAYSKADGVKQEGAVSGLIAHHLLVADRIAEVFESLASEEVQTVVLVSPNHFSAGLFPAQISKGAWKTPFGTVESDVGAVNELLSDSSLLRHEEAAFTEEHGIYGLMPFVATSFPNARVVSIVVREDISAGEAWELGQTIAATLPDAVLLASVDMTHYQDAAYTAANDAQVLTLLENGGTCNSTPCDADLDVDSNSSLRVLFGFNQARGQEEWHKTYHGSSLAMGAAKTAADNTSHILGYFLPGSSVLYSP